jgi:hypothetical protein
MTYKLKDYTRYKRAYVRGSKSHTERMLEYNTRTLLRQMPNGHLYRITAGGKKVLKSNERDRNTGRHTHHNYNRAKNYDYEYNDNEGTRNEKSE